MNRFLSLFLVGGCIAKTVTQSFFFLRNLKRPFTSTTLSRALSSQIMGGLNCSMLAGQVWVSLCQLELAQGSQAVTDRYRRIFVD